MVELLLLIIIGILLFIAYKLNRLEKRQIILENPKASSALSSSLNPLFSEEEITLQKNITAEWQVKVAYYFDLLQRTEKEEIEKHHALAKEIAEFKPSAKLTNILLQEALALVGRDTTKVELQRMIEANIAIINGKSITEVSGEFTKHRSLIPWQNTELAASAWAWENEPDIKKRFEENLKQRSEFWRGSWDYILEKDYLSKE